MEPASRSSSRPACSRDSGVRSARSRGPATQTGVWRTAEPEASGLDTAKLDVAARLAETTRADSLVVVRHGRIVFERYWNDLGPDDVQQMYSATKSPFAFLVGRMLGRGAIESLDQPLVDFVPELAGQGREALTFRNVMAMESGLAQSLALDQGDARAGRTQLQAVLARETRHRPYEYYIYNNAAYRVLFTALERAAGLSLSDLTREELFAPLGMTGAYWVEIRNGDRLLGYQSIRMRPRDLAKVGQVMLNDGMWNGARYLPTEFIAQLRTAPAPKANPSYGLFWHLNAGDFYLSYRESDRMEGPLLAGTPPDAYANFGNSGQVIVVVPSPDLVWIRTGQQIPSDIWEPDSTVATAVLNRLFADLSTAVMEVEGRCRPNEIGVFCRSPRSNSPVGWRPPARAPLLGGGPARRRSRPGGRPALEALPADPVDFFETASSKPMTASLFTGST